MSREAVSLGLRFEILSRDHYTCQYCGAKAPDAALHVDHVTPVIRGGTNSPDNLVAACVRCNLGKSDKEKIDFEDHRPFSRREAGLADHAEWYAQLTAQLDWAHDVYAPSPEVRALLMVLVRHADPWGGIVALADDVARNISVSKSDASALLRGLETAGYFIPSECHLDVVETDFLGVSGHLNYQARKPDEHFRRPVVSDHRDARYFATVERVYG